jgi:ketosteroid isomerase-like protein
MRAVLPIQAQADITPVSVVRGVYQAINERDYDAGLALLDERFEWLEPDHALLGRRHHGIDGVREALDRWVEVFEDFAIEPEEFEAHEERVAVAVRQWARGGASGAEVEIRIGHLWTVSGGKVVALEVFPAREDAFRALASVKQG